MPRCLSPSPKGNITASAASFAGLTTSFNRNADRYQRGVAHILRTGGRWLLLYVGIIGIMAFLFLHLPSSFLPQEVGA
ncbi:efflux RND transporter permease subunit [Pantoea ananatis]